MRKLHLATVVLFAVIVLSALPANVQAAGGSYCGVLKLQVTGMTMDFHIFDTGGPFKIVQGIFLPTPTADDPDFKPVIFSGTGQVITTSRITSPTFFVNFSQSQDHETNSRGYRWRDGRIGQLSLNLTTKTGEIWNTGVDDCQGNGCSGVVVNSDDGTMLDLGYNTVQVTVVGELPSCRLVP